MRWVFVLTLVACRSTPSEPDLVGEFANAYPAVAVRDGKLVEVAITAAETELALIDGKPLRVWAYNGSVPGPTIRVRLGDTLRVRFTNQLPQETTIHWHGVRVPNGMDGVPHMTQPPVAPGASFTYEFTPKDAGTFWFHPHVRSSEQVERGLYGLLIVEDKAPPPFTRDVAWILDDWTIVNGQIHDKFNTLHDLAHDGRWGNAITVNGRRDTKLTVASGERIRLRLLNASNGRVYAPDLAGLDARILAVDGLYTREPVPLERFELAPGNRVDLDVTITGGGRSLIVMDRFVPPRPNRLAEIEIDGSVVTPAFTPPRQHVPAWTTALGTPVTHEFRLDARSGGRFGIEWTIDGVAFAGHEHAHHHAGLTLVRNQWARLRFVNASARLHPIHLHGMFFKLLARDSVAVDEPFFRDTVLVHGNERIDIGLVPLDAGSWMMHCHILEHAEAGMMTMIDVR